MGLIIMIEHNPSLLTKFTANLKTGFLKFFCTNHKDVKQRYDAQKPAQGTRINKSAVYQLCTKYITTKTLITKTSARYIFYSVRNARFYAGYRMLNLSASESVNQSTYPTPR